MVVDKEKVYEVKEIFNNKLYYGKLQYLVRWMGYPYSENTWLAKDNITGLPKLIKLFYRVYLNKFNATLLLLKRKCSGRKQVPNKH